MDHYHPKDVAQDKGRSKHNKDEAPSATIKRLTQCIRWSYEPVVMGEATPISFSSTFQDTIR